MEHGRLAKTDDRDVDRCPAFDQPGLLKVSDDKGIVALFLGLDRIADCLGRAPELG